jgi:hypothetical protein
MANSGSVSSDTTKVWKMFWGVGRQKPANAADGFARHWCVQQLLRVRGAREEHGQRETKPQNGVILEHIVFS